MAGKESVKAGSFDLVKEGSENILRINFVGTSYLPSVSESAVTMALVIDAMVEVSGVNQIVLLHRRNYVYDADQTQILGEISRLYNYFIKQKKILSLDLLVGTGSERYVPYWRGVLQYVVLNLLRSDPIGAFVELRRLIRAEKIKIKKTEDFDEAKLRQDYLEVLTHLYGVLRGTKMISLVRNSLAGYSIGSRAVYRQVFHPAITPDFLFTKLMADPPLDGDEIDAYMIDAGTAVTVFKTPKDIKYLYHVQLPEFQLEEDKYALLDKARNAMIEHKPKKEEFTDPDKMRDVFYNIGRDLLQELAVNQGISLSYKESMELAQILVRYTVGFGMIEILLKDPKIQDIVINGPIGETPIFIVHQDHGECVTNIIPSREDGEGWATKFRLLSGRPLDEANPVLDTGLLLPWARARVAIMTRPLTPVGLAFAFRRHRDAPWTYPLFIQNGMMNALAAGLLDFVVQGGRSILFAGTRSSGKTSILGGTIVEIKRKYRVITIEDTQELAVDALRKLGYNIQPMKVRSALTKESSELGADEGIRTSLRFGDSSLIVGEVRSKEAKSLYEAMRIGSLSNVVAGTIHGGDPYSVFDRVVNDLNVPRTSFKATDIIVISNPVRSADGLHSWRRILGITEVGKSWEEDPQKENGFRDLMKYNPGKDTLEPTQDLLNGESDVLKSIAGTIKEYVGNWDAVWNNILLRSQVKGTLVDLAEKSKMPELLESDFVVQSNDIFHQISDRIMEENGSLDNKKVFLEWQDWLKGVIKQRK